MRMLRLNIWMYLLICFTQGMNKNTTTIMQQHYYNIAKPAKTTIEITIKQTNALNKLQPLTHSLVLVSLFSVRQEAQTNTKGYKYCVNACEELNFEKYPSYGRDKK